MVTKKPDCVWSLVKLHSKWFASSQELIKYRPISSAGCLVKKMKQMKTLAVVWILPYNKPLLKTSLSSLSHVLVTLNRSYFLKRFQIDQWGAGIGCTSVTTLTEGTVRIHENCNNGFAESQTALGWLILFCSVNLLLDVWRATMLIIIDHQEFRGSTWDYEP